MKLRIIFAACVAIISTAACANFAIFQTSNGEAPAAVICNVITGVATGVGAGTCASTTATCNGVADDSTAFGSVNDWAVNTWQASHTGLIEIYVPPGSHCNFATPAGSCSGFGTNCPFNEILQVRGRFTGVTFTGVNQFGAVQGQVQGASYSARTQTVSSGSNCLSVILPGGTPTITDIQDNGSGSPRVTVTSTAGLTVGDWIFISGVGGAGRWIDGNRKIGAIINGTTLDIVLTAYDSGHPYTSGGAIVSPMSMFVVGRWALMTGYDLQGSYQFPFGYPSSQHYFEYVQIDSVNTGTGQVCFTQALQNNYLSTWSNYNSGSQFEVDAGGPATLYAIEANWDTEVEIIGGTFNSPDNPVYARGRSITYRGSANTTFGFVPSQNKLFQCFNCTNGHIEFDKLVDRIYFSGGTITEVSFQSSSINEFEANGVTVTSYWLGTPKRMILTNATISAPVEGLRVGAIAFGRSDSFVCTNSSITTLLISGARVEKGPGDVGVNNDYSITAGVISVPIANGAVPWAVPGTNLRWVGSTDSETALRVLSTTQTATHTVVTTNLALNDWPDVPLESGTKLFIGVHPSPSFSSTDCTVNGVPVTVSEVSGDPMFSYLNLTSASGAAPVPFTGQQIWGALESITITVAQAYTGAQGTLNFRPFGINGQFVLLSDYSQVNFAPTINLKQAGVRIITPSGITCNGSPGVCSGDTITNLGEAFWMTGPLGPPSVSANVISECTGSPAVCFSLNIEIKADQSVVLPYLLNRDLDPAANDNTPAFLNKAA